MDEMLTRILDCMGPAHGAGKELADDLGISANVITNWKNGSNRSYRKYVNQIAAHFGVSPDYLTGKINDKFLQGEESYAAANGVVPAAKRIVLDEASIQEVIKREVDKKIKELSFEQIVQNQKDPAKKGEVSDDELKFALFGGGPVTDAQFEEVKRFAQYVKQRDDGNS